MTVTPSNVNEATTGCIRFVGWSFVDPIPFEQSAAAALGDEVHDKLDLYNKAGVSPYDGTYKEDGTPNKDGSLAGDLALLALPYAPKPLTGLAEGYIRWTPKRAPDVTFSMRKDWTGRTSQLNGIAGVDDMPANVDYKTSKDLDYGVFGEEKFYQDGQGLIYAEQLMEETASDRVYNRWLYVRTPGKKKPAAIPSNQVMERERTHAAMDRLVYPIARKLEQMKRKGMQLNVLDLPANVRNCNSRKYGPDGCPRKNQCNLTPAEIMLGIEGEDHYMDALLAMLEGSKPVSAQPAMVAAVAQHIAPVVSINPPPVEPVHSLANPTTPVDFSKPVTIGSGSVAFDALVERTSTPAAKVATATALLASCTDEEIGRVVRFLFGR